MSIDASIIVLVNCAVGCKSAVVTFGFNVTLEYLEMSLEGEFLFNDCKEGTLNIAR
jgi:hypothetical protein